MKSSEKNNANFGLLKRMYNGLKLWLSKAKLFFIRIVAHSTNPPLSSESDVIDNQFPILLKEFSPKWEELRYVIDKYPPETFSFFHSGKEGWKVKINLDYL